MSKYILRCDLEVNKTFAEVTKLLENVNFNWHRHIRATPWEEKVFSLLHYITSMKDKPEVILELEAGKNAPVPCSETYQLLSARLAATFNTGTAS